MILEAQELCEPEQKNEGILIPLNHVRKRSTSQRCLPQRQGQTGVSIKKVNRSHSYHTNSSSFGMSCSPSRCKSDGTFSIDNNFTAPKECHKEYELSESLENDDNSINDHTFSEYDDDRNRQSVNSVNSDLDNLEVEILRKISEQLQTDETSINSVDSNIKVLKTTIQNIFSSFNDQMEDFTTFKVKFNEILQKYKGDSVGEMEEFIQNLLEHVSSAESNNKKPSHKIISKSNQLQDVYSTLDTFNNANFTTATSADCESFDVKNSCTASLNTIVSSDNMMNKRKLFSEINIREHFVDLLITQLASTENIRKIEAKKIELENYAQQKKLHPYKDIKIPVKVTSAKKDLYLNKDFMSEKNEDDQFFIFKICRYICKKIRKNTFA